MENRERRRSISCRIIRPDRQGGRAADSPLYLGVAMGRLKEEKRACVAFLEFRQTYPAEMVGRLKNQYEAAIKPVTCNL